MPQIPTKEVRDGLKRLIADLDRADLSSLKGKPGAKAKDANAWVEMLRTAEAEMEQWCPNSQFTIDVPPKAR